MNEKLKERVIESRKLFPTFHPRSLNFLSDVVSFGVSYLAIGYYISNDLCLDYAGMMLFGLPVLSQVTFMLTNTGKLLLVSSCLGSRPTRREIKRRFFLFESVCLPSLGRIFTSHIAPIDHSESKCGSQCVFDVQFR